jgi:hypothetical protein
LKGEVGVGYVLWVQGREDGAERGWGREGIISISHKADRGVHQTRREIECIEEFPC